MISAFRLWCAALLLATGFAASAGAADIFTVRGIHVDKTADSATAARTAAQAEGQRLALTAMMRKLTLPEDWPSLPEVDEAAAQNAVRGFQVANERTSSTRYMAEMIVSFQPEAVRRLLRGANVAFGETQARPALLLPVLHRDGQLILWEDDNPWRGAWASLEPGDEMTPLILPIGEIMEINSVPAATALSASEDALTALTSLAANYGANEVIVAEATPGEGGLRVTLTRRGGIGASEPLSSTYDRQGREMGDLMKAAAADMLNSLSTQWKRQIIVRDGRVSTMVVQADFANLTEWESIRKGLTSTPLVQGMEVSGISSRAAEIRISHKGSTEMLALSLAQQNVELSRADAAGMEAAQVDPSGPAAASAPRWRLAVRR
ncbi:DUF2066 domain-containing protein [Parvibaculum sp.]|uniref:DUF2066 domain-containing protein n=1 Tax=Parvibaculum sp. TaxID=2024848 RepID=UPI00391A8F05